MSGAALVVVLGLAAVSVLTLAGWWLYVAVLRRPPAPRPGELRAGGAAPGNAERTAAHRSTWMQGGGGGSGI